MSEARRFPDDALAIVGLAFRLPGGIVTLEELWSALCSGQSLITDVPSDRFDKKRFFDDEIARPGKSYTFAGGYIGDVSGFDADYFGISPREAALMDPQHRLLLEMTAEAFDDAAIDPDSVTGSDAAVFIGMSDMAYMGLQMMTPETMTAHTVSGGTLSRASNRLSYMFDLRGPSMTIDTACSSMMVAFHQACRTILSGQSPMAVVGGMHLLLSPYGFVGFSKATMLSPSGRCATFSANADGYVRAEGGGVLIVKRLSDALASGDRVHAVVLATHANTDGRTSGMAVPSVDVQEALLREAYASAEVDADDVTYFEAHGTGTPVGDPIECEAIGRALGRRRSLYHPLPIGSVKTNLGHMEPASGIPGILKAILVLRHRTIPPSLHGTPANPHIDFAALGLAPVHQSQPIEGDGGVVGVNSFGFGGANAHAVLAKAPDTRTAEQPATGARPVTVSARTPQALTEAAERLSRQLSESTQEDFYDICYTASRRRGTHHHRAVVLASCPPDAAKGLASIARGETGAGARETAVRNGKVAFVFSGNGTQWPAMGADLIEAEPVFRTAIEMVDRVLAPRLGWSVLAEMVAPSARSRLGDTTFAQPTLFALQVGLVELLAERGFRPAAVIGHSVGEVAAAWAAGALDLDAACAVVAARSAAQGSTAGRGRMAALGTGQHRAEQLLVSFSGRLELAAVNTDRDVTISGDKGALAELASHLDTTVFFRDLDLDYPFHSRVMEPLEQPLRAALADLRPVATTLPFVSTVTGGRLNGADLDAHYWWRNLREPVLFAQGTNHLLGEGYDVFVEIGPHPALSAYLRHTTSSYGPAAVIPTLRRDSDGVAAMTAATAALLAAGASTDQTRFFPDPGRVVDLPPYPWQRERHWHGTGGLWVRSGGDGTIDHLLLGERMQLLEPTWMGSIEPALLPWLPSHRLLGTVVMPAAGFIEMAIAAGRRIFDAAVEINDLAIPAALPLTWDPNMDVRIQTSVSRDDGAIRIASQTGTGGDWRLHAQGAIRRLLCDAPPPVDTAAFREETTNLLETRDLYMLLDELGVNYGSDFQILHDIHVLSDQVLARYRSDIDQDGYEAHPVILDSVLHGGAPFMEGRHFLPSAVDRVRLWRQPPPTGIVRVSLRSRSSREVCWDAVVCDDDGNVVAELNGCRLRRVGGDKAPPPRYVTVMRAAAHADQPGAPTVMAGPHELAAAAQGRIDALKAEWDHDAYEYFERETKEGAAHYAMAAVHDMLAGRQVFTTDDILAAGMLPKYTSVWKLLSRLGERYGLIERCGRQWRVLSKELRYDIGEELFDSAPSYSTEFLVYLRILRHVSDILCGRQDPIDIMFGDTGTYNIEHFYDTAPLVRWHNRLALSLVEPAISNWPADRNLRVLEVGAGTGGMSAALLPTLPPDRTEYFFTDISAALFPRAQTRFQEYDFVQYRCLDLDDDLQQQGFPEAAFDLIVASNALHVAQDLRQSLCRLRRLLVPNGQLLALESHDPEMLVVFAFLKQFWSFTDTDLRPESPLLARDQWPAVLRDCGYHDTVQIGADSEPARSDFSVILARRDGQHHACALPAAPSGASWVLVIESPADRGIAHELADALSSAGSHTAVSIPGDDDQLWAAQVEVGQSIVYILGGEHDECGHAAVARAGRRFEVLRTFAQACGTFPPEHGTTLWLVTRPSGALPGPEKPLIPADAALWGAARTLANEYPDCTVKRISWERSEAPTADTHRLALELLTPSAEDEVALTTAGRFVPRQIERHRPRRLVGRNERGYRAELRQQGLLYHLAWTEAEPLSPAGDEVVIEVKAAALNYRDVMMATGMLPPDAEGPGPGDQLVGLECAGVVTAAGKNVTSVRIGDRVCGVASGTFASHAATKADLLVAIPDDMDFVEAATIPIAFLTVHHSLEHVARLASGETVVVHGAAGGVGLAAIQYAHLVGARVIATAGTPTKRDLLSMLGVEHVFDSRSLNFADQIMALTGGDGVDIVLNSLSGEAIPRGIDMLRPGGRFIELGKRDIYANSRIMLRAFRNNITLSCVDISQLSTTEPALVRSEVQVITHRVNTGDYRPLPHRTYPAARINEAFRLMQHSHHIGKVVVTFDDPVPVEYLPVPINIDPSGTYLITGGLSGVGSSVACGLAKWGVRHLALVGRRGMTSPGAATLVDALAAEGVTATVYAADAADTAAMAAVFAAIDTSGHTLRGVIHGAMQLDDATVDELSGDRFRAAVTPKMHGAMVLDALTRDRALDFMVVFSSMTAVFGNFKQANYAAGNLFLEALVRSRLNRGLPGLAIAWAGISDVGYVARHGLTDTLSAMGLKFVSPDQAMQALGEVLGLPDSVVCVGGMDWSRAASLCPLAKSPRLAGLLPPLIEGTEYRREEFVNILARSTPDDAAKLVEDTLAQIVAGILETQTERVDRSRRLDEMGMDSLMSIELVTASWEQFQCEIPLMELATSAGTINAIAELIRRRLGVGKREDKLATDGREVLDQHVVDAFFSRQRST